MELSNHKEHEIMDQLALKKGFETEDEMIRIFNRIFPQTSNINPKTPDTDDKWPDLSKWYSKEHHELTYEHHTRVPPGMVFSCDDLADMWIERWMKTPKDVNPFANPAASGKSVGETYPDTDANSFVLASDKADVYFVYASAFQEPDFRRVLMHREASVLVPVYFSMASKSMFPSIEENKLIEAIENDLKGINYLRASLDGEKLYGCTVVRTKSLRINNIPKNNIFDIPEDRLIDGDSMKVYHGGFWLLTKPLKPGDHLLVFQSNSKNYEMHVKMLITTLA